MIKCIIINLILFAYLPISAQGFCFVELNCENLFDNVHDSLKNDYEYCEGGSRNWNKTRYRRKLSAIGKEIISCGGKGEYWRMPDIVALIEVENHRVMEDLTKSSVLRKANYKFLITDSPDHRGIDVALMYNSSFEVKEHHSIRIKTKDNDYATRDILYVKGKFDEEELHILVVHAPSRSGGKSASQTYRLIVNDVLCNTIDSIFSTNSDANILLAGDFNDYSNDLSIKRIKEHNMINVSENAKGTNGAEGTYRFQEQWGSLDHIFLSTPYYKKHSGINCYVNDIPFLLINDEKYGGVKPRRTYSGFKYDEKGFSDHLPLVMRF